MNSVVIFLADYTILFLFSVPVIFWFFHRRKLAYRVTISAILAWLIGKFIKDFFYFPRPIPMRLMDGSFPSNHTAAAFAISVYVFLHHRRWGTLLLILSVLIGLARVIEGVHFPVDVFGGAILGSLTAFVVDKYHSK